MNNEWIIELNTTSEIHFLSILSEFTTHTQEARKSQSISVLLLKSNKNIVDKLKF